MNFWKIAGLLYAGGVALVVRSKYRKAEQVRVPDSVEDQLDAMIHASQISQPGALFLHQAD